MCIFSLKFFIFSSFFKVFCYFMLGSLFLVHWFFFFSLNGLQFTYLQYQQNLSLHLFHFEQEEEGAGVVVENCAVMFAT